MAEIPVFGEISLMRFGDILGVTNGGFTGSEIRNLLAGLSIPVVDASSKRTLITSALLAQQQRDGNGSGVILFIEAAMAPVRYSGGERTVFETRLSQLNQVLAFSGFELQSTGRVTQREKALTLDDPAVMRADQLRDKLERRGVHADVLKSCQAEFLQDNYFHAVFEATKSVAEKIRAKTGLTSDGAALVDAAFGGETPKLAINMLHNDTQRKEQSGFVNILKGMFGVFRNTTAHIPKIVWPISEQDALDLMSLASYLHRRIDAAQPPTL